MTRVALVAGTRPEFVKLHPVALALAEREIPLVLVTTEQHRTAMMRDAFLRQLSWPCAIEALPVSAQDSLTLLAQIVEALPKALRSGDIVVVEGDTTSVLAAALVANKLGFRLGHVEAGLRSYDLRMPEEHNRRIVDHIADYLFAPTEFDAAHLRQECVPGQVFVVGNPVLDAVRQNVARIDSAARLGSDFVLVTLHRQENVGEVGFLRQIVEFFGSVGGDSIFPVHPRTRDRLEAAGLWSRLEGVPGLRLLEPLDYLSFLAAMRDARVIVTDSGGVQEEATAGEIRRPVIVVRRSTERVPALREGFSVLAPADATVLGERVRDLSWFRPSATSPFGDGHSGQAIAAVLAKALES